MSLQNKLKAAWLGALLLLIAASLSQGVDSKNAFGLDILFHIGIYAVLSAVPLIVLRKRFSAFIVTLAVAPLGFFFEAVHGSMTGYGFKMVDALYNNLGVTIGVVAGLIIRMKQHLAHRQDTSA
ncbi:hypothetical protein [Chlorobium sp. N1]|uniref:hypothetical protein n=1 Tax=Chlorobium sp. N1 TaxID=2491138 RepID=UPI00103D30F2|nr:hypothetical protein [Chlorobium sp. N1]TCD48549.1 hypothetical protein E0L29_01330 [Chlorobium sp. N1]